MEEELSASTIPYDAEEKEKKIIEMKKIIEKYELEYKKNSRKAITETFYSTNIYEIFRRHLVPENFAQHVKNEEWEELELQFALYFPTITESIRNGQKALTEEQWRVCMLIVLGFKESDIQIFMDIDRQRLNRLKIQTNNKIFNVQNASSLRQNLHQLHRSI